MIGSLATAVLLLSGCWLEPANAPHSRPDNAFSRVWEGEYRGYGHLTWEQTYTESGEDVVLRVHDRNHNYLSFELNLTPTRDLAPRLTAEGQVQDTVRCYIVDQSADVKQVVDIYRARGNIYGGIQVLDYNDNVIWKIEALDLLPQH